MFDDLEHYLSSLIPRERIDTILNILNSITNLVGPDPVVTFSQYPLGVPVEVDPMEEIARFDDAMENLIFSTLGDLGIVLDDEQYNSGRLPVIEKLLSAIESVVSWQDAERLMAIMLDTDNHEMAIAELAGEINGEDDTDYALLIESVSDAFYNNLLDVIQSNADADQAEVAATTGGPLTRIRDYFQNKPESFVSRGIRNNVITFGLEYAFYLKFYENYLWDFKPDELLTALIDFAMCSSLPDGDVGPAVIKHIVDYAEGVEVSQQYLRLAERAVVNLPQQYNQPTGAIN